MTGTIELLAPARDAATAIAAILAGADAVYIGAERFGARQAASNPISAIKKAADFAHQFYARVYVTLNTLLYDRELASAEKMIHEFYEIGVDGLIIQDAGLLELDLPPIPLIASTQMHNNTPEKVKFWQDVGFSRVILDRELTLAEIRRIRSLVAVELECFIHGALCVGVSGQCYMSYALGGRSGNRGQCAQPCRRLYSVRDEQGKMITQDRHLLSLKDLNLAAHLEDLIDAGVNSFKIEGRLKDVPYVVNTVAFYRRTLDAILEKKGLKRASSGCVRLDFKPDPAKTFNRGFTDYGLTGEIAAFGSIETPKSLGEFIGVVHTVHKTYVTLDRPHDLHNADGICFFDQNRNLSGTTVNRVEGDKIYPLRMQGLQPDRQIYRNYDHLFCRNLEAGAAHRKLRLSILLRETDDGLILIGTDEDANTAQVNISGPKQPAAKKDTARQTISTQLSRIGNTIFDCPLVSLETKDVYFLPASVLNAARRDLVRRLIEIRQSNRPSQKGGHLKNNVPFPQKNLSFTGNVLNSKAETFYRRHGVETIAPAAESGLDLSGKVVMTTKYCLRRQLGLCKRPASKIPASPLVLLDETGREYRIIFHCGKCAMDVIL